MSKETLENVLKWNQRALKKAEHDRDTAAIERLSNNITHLEKELKNVG